MRPVDLGRRVNGGYAVLGCCHGNRSFVLHGEDFGHTAVITMRPKMAGGLRFYQLDGDVDVLVATPPLPFKMSRTPNSRATCLRSTGRPL